MAEPKKRLSKTRTHRRRAQYKIDATAVVLCKNCGKPSRPHFVCPACGYYNGKSVKTSVPTQRITLDSNDAKSDEK
ncbi:MAG: 50S ribosomal protein L32 [Patescibacteria group bacterium]